MIELTIPKVYALLAECVEEKGEGHVYEAPEGAGCMYVHGTEMVTVGTNDYGQPIEEEQVGEELTPGCLVGSVLIKAGLDPQVFVDLNINRATSAGGALIALLDDEHVSIKAGDYHGVDAMLIVAQDRQDRGETWGAALKAVKPEFDLWGSDDTSV